MAQPTPPPPPDNAWADGYIPGVGNVPGGPRVRGGLSTTSDRNALTTANSTVTVPNLKTEDTNQATSTLPSIERAISAQAPSLEDGYIKLEPLSDQEAADVGIPESYINDFSRVFAAYNRSTRGNMNGSRRQIIDANATRERADIRLSTTSRDRTRSPTRLRTSDSLRLNRQSPMFFPLASRQRRDSSISTMSTSPNHASTDLRDGASLSRTGTPVTDPADSEAQSPDKCQCPISYNCSHRRPTQLDCRPLVREWESWQDRQDQEAFDLHRMAAPHGDNTTTANTVGAIMSFVDDFEQAQTARRREIAVRDMRNWILDMEDVTLTLGAQQDTATQQVIPQLTQFLHPENTRFRRAGRLPMYIEEELTVLKVKWSRGDFDGSLRRGLTAVVTRDVNGTPIRTRYQVDPHWLHYKSGLYFGAGDLVNGQIWMTRAELMRDGVHAPPIAGISGSAKKGAYSIVLGEFDEKKNHGYADIDMGDAIDYMGTALKDEEDPPRPTNEEDPHMHIPGAWNANVDAARTPTAATRAMMKSLETKDPVRVIRSWKQCGVVRNKPRKGYRYDGLYKVVGMTALKEARQIWSFRLERQGDQGRLRGFARNDQQPDSTGRRKGYFYRDRR